MNSDAAKTPIWLAYQSGRWQSDANCVATGGSGDVVSFFRTSTGTGNSGIAGLPGPVNHLGCLRRKIDENAWTR